jgi:hypothetical protein
VDRLYQTDPDEALQLWQGLIEGTWSLVDQCTPMAGAL